MSKKFDATKYRILRTPEGDILQRFRRGYEGSINCGGGVGGGGSPMSYIIADEWIELSYFRAKETLINKIKNCKDVPIVYTKRYLNYVKFLNEKERNPKRSFWEKLLKKEYPKPQDFVQSFPKYLVKHLIVIEN